MQKITPHLWFDKEAKEAVQFYTSIFSHSRIVNITTIHEVPTPTGDCDMVSFELSGETKNINRTGRISHLIFEKNQLHLLGNLLICSATSGSLMPRIIT